jgi:hypothetical protein
LTDGTASIEQFLAGVAAEAGADAPRRSGSKVEFERAGRVFASASGDAAEFRLDPEIAEAALRTPSTAASDRGQDWVLLAPGEVTDMDLDRARAWFLSAWRLAGGK